MFAMITTEEYKELLLAKQYSEALEEDNNILADRVIEAEECLRELLLMLTKGHTSVNWSDKKFAWHDLARSEEVAEYLNKNYVIDGRLQFEKVKENTDE